MCVFYLLPNNNDVTANKYIIAKDNRATRENL